LLKRRSTRRPQSSRNVGLLGIGSEQQPQRELHLAGAADRAGDAPESGTAELPAPLVGGAATLPADIEDRALAKASVTRAP